MTVEQFIQDFGFSERDSFSAIKLYSGQEKTKEEWIKELKGKFNFSFTDKKSNNSRQQNKDK
ncbi:MAG TPA: hypothetical protein PKI46_06350 [Bacteroidales bacterium]|nr:hypothetical protein [Bacteroidales bacterium]